MIVGLLFVTIEVEELSLGKVSFGGDPIEVEDLSLGKVSFGGDPINLVGMISGLA